MAVHTLVDERPSQGSLVGYPNGASRKKAAPALDNDPLQGTAKDFGIELFEDESLDPPSTLQPRRLSVKPWLLHGLVGALLGGTVCLALWSAGLEPPGNWRVGGGASITLLPQAHAADPETLDRPSNPVPPPDKLPATQVSEPSKDVELRAESERLRRLLEARATELGRAQENARQARRLASEAAVVTNSLEKDLQTTKAKLARAEGRLQDMKARQSTPPPSGRPTSTSAPIGIVRQPEQAFLHYTKGLRLYQEHRHTEAETEFQAAIERDDQDARYHYFLGLSRLELGKKEPAQEGFRLGAKLERENKPSRVFVSVALESASKENLKALRPFRP